jgi:hypothetical protein
MPIAGDAHGIIGGADAIRVKPVKCLSIDGV